MKYIRKAIPDVKHFTLTPSGKINRKRTEKMAVALFAVVLILLIVSAAILLLKSPGTVVSFCDENGNVLRDSIAEKVFVEINGIRQGMFIKGENRHNPVLLFVHGGPGMPEYFLAEKYNTDLEKYFTVCYWEQRGAGISYSPDLAYGNITALQLVSDTAEVTNYLRERFGKEKIYLLGHSWGTFIALQAAAEYPQLYDAYIGISQVSNTQKSETIAYDYMLKQYIANDNTDMADRLKKYDIHNGEESLRSYFASPLRDEAMHTLGVGSTREMRSVISGIFLPVMNCKAYTLSEKINLWRAKAILKNAGILIDELFETDLSRTLTKLEIPVYFMGGAYDYTVNFDMQKEYFNQIQAPIKGFYTFNASAHSPLFEEPEHFLNIMLNDVLHAGNNFAD